MWYSVIFFYKKEKKNKNSNAFYINILKKTNSSHHVKLQNITKLYKYLFAPILYIYFG